MSEIHNDGLRVTDSMREAMAQEVNRVISPKFLYTLLALSFALLFAAVYVWNVAETNRSWLVAINGNVRKLEAQISVAEELRRQNEILLSIAKHLGVAQNTDNEGED